MAGVFSVLCDFFYIEAPFNFLHETKNFASIEDS